jgi:pimeloyl-ACP methyl ester carboxylesterase
VSAVEDVDAAIDYIRALRWTEKVHLFGYRWGAQVAGLYAVKNPKKVSKIVLYGLRLKKDPKVTVPPGPTRNNNMTNAALKPDDGDFDGELVKQRAEMCLEADPRSPTGPLRDLTKDNPIDPKQLQVPTLILNGEKDSDPAVFKARLEFFSNLGTASRAVMVLPGLGKYANFERNHARLEAAILGFLDVP